MIACDGLARLVEEARVEHFAVFQAPEKIIRARYTPLVNCAHYPSRKPLRVLPGHERSLWSQHKAQDQGDAEDDHGCPEPQKHFQKQPVHASPIPRRRAHHEQIPGAAHGFDSVVAQFPPEIADMHVDHAIERTQFPTKNNFGQALS